MTTRWRAAIGSAVSIVAGLALLVSSSEADDLLLIAPRTLAHDGPRLLVILPTGAMLASEQVELACTRAMAAEGEILAYSLGPATCRAVRAADLDQPLISLGEVPSFHSVSACLAASYAVLEENTSGLPVCFEWFRCGALHPAISGPVEVCSSGSVVLDAGAGYASYLWTPGGETTQTITVSPASDTIYTVEVTDEWRCAGIAAHLVEVRALPEPTIAGPTRVVLGQQAILDTAEGFTSYLWSPGGEATAVITISPTVTTVYQVTVTDANGCAGTSSVHTVEVIIEADIFADGFETGTTEHWSATTG